MQMILNKRLMLAIALIASFGSVQSHEFVNPLIALGGKKLTSNTLLIKFVVHPWMAQFVQYFPAHDVDLFDGEDFQLTAGELYRLALQIAVEVANKQFINGKVDVSEYVRTYTYGMLLHKLAAAGFCALKLDKLFTKQEIAAYKKWAAGLCKGILGGAFDQLVCLLVEQIRTAQLLPLAKPIL